MGSEAFTVSLDTRCDGRSETDIDEPSNPLSAGRARYFLPQARCRSDFPPPLFHQPLREPERDRLHLSHDLFELTAV